jgi:hypothetical protein
VVIPAGHYRWRSLFFGAHGRPPQVSAFIGINTGGFYDGERANIAQANWRRLSTTRATLPTT